MNLHVFSDAYGLFPVMAAKRIVQLNDANNICVNLCIGSNQMSEKIQYIERSKKAFKMFIQNLQAIDKIILHPLNYDAAIFLLEGLKKFPNAKVYWVCWSYEVYNYHIDNRTFFDDFSKNFYLENTSIKTILKEGVRSILSLLRIPFFSKYHLKNAYARVNYFCSFLEEDYTEMKRLTGYTQMEYLPFSYTSLEELMPSLSKYKIKGDAIIVGHAASLESNQFEILHALKKIALQNKIILPIAYGNTKYQQEIIKEAKDLFAGQVDIIEQKMSLEDYYVKLEEASFAIFNLKIQQGLGNMLGLLWIGTKVFLREESSTYKQFKKWNLLVYSTQHQLTAIELQKGLQQNEIEANREILFARFTEKSVNSYWKQIVY